MRSLYSETSKLFQFHKGTIKTLGWIKDEVLATHFNSIKVRLKLRLITIVFLLVLIFQFHKGTIKTFGLFPRTVVVSRNFNSVKVRLKLNIQLGEIITAHIFQFHKGTIKTV